MNKLMRKIKNEHGAEFPMSFKNAGDAVKWAEKHFNTHWGYIRDMGYRIVECEDNTVYAVCDAKGNVKSSAAYFDESKADAACDYLSLSDNNPTYTIRPYALTPINE